MVLQGESLNLSSLLNFLGTNERAFVRRALTKTFPIAADNDGNGDEGGCCGDGSSFRSSEMVVFFDFQPPLEARKGASFIGG